MHGDINTQQPLAATVGLVSGTRDPETDPWCSPDGDTTNRPPFWSPPLPGQVLQRPGRTDNLQ